VPVVVADLASFRRIVDDPGGPLGAYADPASPPSIARAIRLILERPSGERAALRARCLDAAQQRWNWEVESAKLLAIYERIGASITQG
jgi:glycosyltransferase involved in cell wall biosynthesis